MNVFPLNFAIVGNGPIAAYASTGLETRVWAIERSMKFDDRAMMARKFIVCVISWMFGDEFILLPMH
jgi:hypothetical protein